MSAPTLRPAKYSRTTVPSGCPLTPREFDAIGLLAQGLRYREIAERSGRAIGTVRTQLHTAYKRLGVSTGRAAVATCQMAGWFNPPDITTVDLEPEPVEDQAVSSVQRLYLAKFDRWLRTRSDTDRLAKDCLMDAMFWERELLPPSLRTDRHPQKDATSRAMRLAA